MRSGEMKRGQQEDLPEELNTLTSQIIKAAMEVHTELGPGLYEKVYRKCMARELSRLGVPFDMELPVAVVYKGEPIDEEGYKIDLLVDGQVVVELKSVETVTGTHKKQVLTCLRLKQKAIGLLINFNVEHLRDGIFRTIDPRRDLSQR
jgi:GxxExxY protein